MIMVVIYLYRGKNVLLLNARDVRTMHRVFIVSSQASMMALPCGTVLLNLCETAAR